MIQMGLVVPQHGNGQQRNPTVAMALPTALTVSPIHSNRKFRCRSRPPTRRGVNVTSCPAACTF
jgi:hypothetical protein